MKSEIIYLICGEEAVQVYDEEGVRGFSHYSEDCVRTIEITPSHTLDQIIVAVLSAVDGSFASRVITKDQYDAIGVYAMKRSIYDSAIRDLMDYDSNGTWCDILSEVDNDIDEAIGYLVDSLKVGIEESQIPLYKSLLATITPFWKHTDARSVTIYEDLKRRYHDSDVVSGEFIYSLILTSDYPEEIVRAGIQMFLDWDDSPAKFDLVSGKKHWFVNPPKVDTEDKPSVTVDELVDALGEIDRMLSSIERYLPKSIKNSDTFHFLNVQNNVVKKLIRKAQK